MRMAGSFGAVVFRRSAKHFRPLDQVRDEPVVLLMSASGIGKSTALAQERDALTPSASGLVNLKSLAGKQDAVAHLSAATQMPSPVACRYLALGQRGCLTVPGLPFTGLIPGYQHDRVPPGIEDMQDAVSLRPAEPGRSSFRFSAGSGGRGRRAGVVLFSCERRIRPTYWVSPGSAGQATGFARRCRPARTGTSAGSERSGGPDPGRAGH